MTPDIEQIIERLDRLKRLMPLARLLTVRNVIEAGDDAIRAAGLNPWCMNEGRATGDERIDLPVSEADVDEAIIALRAVQWRPASDVLREPRDETPILTKNMNQGGVMAVAWWSNVYGYWVASGGKHLHQFTHFMEIPPLPAARASKEG